MAVSGRSDRPAPAEWADVEFATGKLYPELEKHSCLTTYLVFLGFRLQMPDTKFQPTNTMKTKDKSSEQRFGHVDATNRYLYLNVIFY